MLSGGHATWTCHGHAALQHRGTQGPSRDCDGPAVAVRGRPSSAPVAPMRLDCASADAAHVHAHWERASYSRTIASRLRAMRRQP
eukprot:438043-Pyramimonas_sp.AAC.1